MANMESIAARNAARPCLSPDQVEAIARQLPGRHERELMRLQKPDEPRNTGPLTGR